MLDILFENENAVAAVKPGGVLSQGAADSRGDTDMLTLVSEYIKKPAYLINRLDRCTGGIILFAKSSEAAGKLTAFASDKDKCIKEYLAVVSGSPEDNEGELRDFLYKDARALKSFVVGKERKGAKEAVLTYRLIATAKGEKGTLSLIRIRLKTGRTHQIRVQFSSRGMPLAGDGKYGSRERLRYSDGTPHPISPKELIALHAFHMSLDAKDTARFDIFSLPPKELYPFSLFESDIARLIRKER